MPDSARSRRDLQNFLLFCTSSKALLSIRLLQLHSDSYLKISCFICLIIIMLTNIHSHFLSLPQPIVQMAFDDAEICKAISLSARLQRLCGQSGCCTLLQVFAFHSTQPYCVISHTLWISKYLQQEYHCFSCNHKTHEAPEIH